MKPFEIKDQYRRNKLSLTPGGCSVMVTFTNGSSRTYDKVKDYNAFSKAIKKNNPNGIHAIEKIKP
jgi:hypothetical protein